MLYELAREFVREDISETLLFEWDGETCLEELLGGASKWAGPDELARIGLIFRLAAPPNATGGVPDVLEYTVTGS